MKNFFGMFLIVLMIVAFSFVSSSASIDIDRTKMEVQSAVDKGNPLMLTAGKAECCVLRGDTDGNGVIDIDDLITMVCCGFSFGFCENCDELCMDHFDVDDSSGFDIADIVYMVNFMFGGGPAPLPC